MGLANISQTSELANHLVSQASYSRENTESGKLGARQESSRSSMQQVNLDSFSEPAWS